MWVGREKRPYRVRARSDRFAVCTKPFNPQHTVLYCILDTERGVRGPENLIFGLGAETDEHCERMLARLEAGDSEVTYRHCVGWDVVRVESPTPEGKEE